MSEVKTTGSFRSNTIDVDQMWGQRDNKNTCSDYIADSRIRRKYIDKAHSEIETLVKELKGDENFSKSRYARRKEIHYLIDFTLRMSNEDMLSLVEANYSLKNFILKVYEIRKESDRRATAKIGYNPHLKR